MIKLIQQVLFVCFSMSLIIQSQAQDAMSLRDCIILAQKNNLDLQLQRLNLKQAELNEKTSSRARLPTINFNGSYGYNFGFAIDPTTNTFANETTSFLNSGIDGRARLFRFGQLGLNVRAAEFNVLSTKNEIIQFERDISLQTANAFLQVVLQDERLQNARRNLQISEQQEKRIELLYNAGATAQADLLNAQAQRIADQQALVEAQNSFELSIFDLQQFMLLDDKPEIDIPDLDPEMMDEYAGLDENKILESAMERDARISAANFRMAAQEYNLKSSKIERLPSLDLFGNINTRYSSNALTRDGFILVEQASEVEIDGEPSIIVSEVLNPIVTESPFSEQLNNNLGQAVGVTLSIPIYNQFQIQASIDREEITMQQRQLELESAKQDLRREVLQAWQNYKAGKTAYEATKKSLEAQEMVLNNANKAQELGAMNSFDYMQSRLQYDNALSNFLQAKYNAIFNIKVLDFYLGKAL
jgi:outer membrane protein